MNRDYLNLLRILKSMNQKACLQVFKVIQDIQECTKSQI